MVRRMRSRRSVAGLFSLFLLTSLGFVAASASCGSRTGLLVENPPERDAGADVLHRLDAPADVVSEDATFLDVFDALPPIDAHPLPDVIVNDCPDAGSTLIYVVTAQNELYSFYPPSGTFKGIGALSCPTPDPTWNPFSMAVDRKGTAYVLFTDAMQTQGLIYRVSTATAACVPTPFMGGQDGFAPTFGMGFVGSSDETTESLYVASDDLGSMLSGTLATIDVNTFLLGPIGPFTGQAVNRAELTGTGDGRLFAFYSIQNNSSSAVAQVDPATAQVTANNDLDGLPQGGGWAFAFWGGAFYLFTAPDGAGTASHVTRFDPGDLSEIQVAVLPTTIVGAGVSTCAPQQ